MKFYLFLLAGVLFLEGCKEEETDPLQEALVRFEGNYDVQVHYSSYHMGAAPYDSFYYDVLQLTKATDTSAIITSTDVNQTVNFLRYDTIKQQYIFFNHDHDLWNCKLTLDMQDDSVFVQYSVRTGQAGGYGWYIPGKK